MSHRYLRRVLLVDVEVLDDALAHKIIPHAPTLGNLGHVMLLELRDASLDDDERSAYPARVRCNVDAAVARVELNRHELAQMARAP